MRKCPGVPSGNDLEVAFLVNQKEMFTTIGSEQVP